jgi:hypothetical protein
VEQKLLCRSQEKVLFFLNLFFFGSEQFQVAEITSFVVEITFSCIFAATQIVDNIGSLPFISWAISMKLSGYYFFIPIYRCAKLH